MSTLSQQAMTRRSALLTLSLRVYLGISGLAPSFLWDLNSMQSRVVCMHLQPISCGDRSLLPAVHTPPLSMIYGIGCVDSWQCPLQVRLVNLTKKAVLPFKNHRGRVKSIAVIDPGAPGTCSCGCAAALTLLMACLRTLLSPHWPRTGCSGDEARQASLPPAAQGYRDLCSDLHIGRRGRHSEAGGPEGA